MKQSFNNFDFNKKLWYTYYIGGHMKSYALKINNSGLPTAIYTGQVFKTGMGVIDDIKSNDFNKVQLFLINKGVHREDIETAMEIMEENGHNKAEFGTFGSFTYSMYEGVLQ